MKHLSDDFSLDRDQSATLPAFKIDLRRADGTQAAPRDEHQHGLACEWTELGHSIRTYIERDIEVLVSMYETSGSEHHRARELFDVKPCWLPVSNGTRTKPEVEPEPRHLFVIDVKGDPRFREGRHKYDFFTYTCSYSDLGIMLSLHLAKGFEVSVMSYEAYRRKPKAEQTQE